MRELPPCRHKALELLARRSHFRAELATKLERRGYEAGEIETTLERLTSEGYLDDRDAARQLAGSRLDRGPVGRRRLLADLERRGAPREISRQVVDELLEDDDESDAVRDAAERWLSRHGDGDEEGGELSEKGRAALARHLERRGFSTRAIVGALRDLSQEKS